jgi:hypothetical protein
MKGWVNRRLAEALVILVSVTVAAGCGGSRAPAATPAAQQTSAYGVALESALRSLALGVQSYYAENQAYPTAVTPATVGQYVSPWPHNPWTEQPISQGSSPGDFTYELEAAGAGFQLVGHKADGTTVVVP